MTTNINSLSTNKVDKTGDTMSGLLTINKSETNLRFKNPTLDINENPLSSIYYGLEYSDKNGERIAVIEASKLTTGDTGIKIASKNNNVENSLYLGVKSNGEPTMLVSNPTLWRDALGLSDTGWLTLTNSSVFTGTIYYRKIGNFVEVTAGQLKLVTDLTDGAGRILATLPEGFRPQRNIFIFAGNPNINGIGMGTVATNGDIRFQKNSTSGGNFLTTTNLYLTGCYTVV
jgi:hypothetical protein